MTEEKKENFRKKIKELYKDDAKAQEFMLDHALRWLFGAASDDAIIRAAYIIGGDRADPDAAASGKSLSFALNEMANLFNEEFSKNIRFEHTSFGEGLSKFAKNSAFKRACEIELFELKNFHAENFDHVFGFETSRLIGDMSYYAAVWDTHSSLPESEKTFIDIRLDYNATSSIMIRYIVPFLKEDREEVTLLCTALKYGIESDYTSTGGMKKKKKETELEKVIDAYIDSNILDTIHDAPPKKTDYWPLVKRTEMGFFGSFAVFGVGFLSSDQENYLVELANELSRDTDGILTVLVFGIVDGEKIVYKIRVNEKSTVDLDELDGLIQCMDMENGKSGDSGKRMGAGGGTVRLFPKPRSDMTDEQKEQYCKDVYSDMKERIKSLLASMS